jgi:hypothetical protein
MKLARYWTRAQAETTTFDGKTVSVQARGWSDDSLDSARTRAREIAQRVAERIASKDESKQRYPYGDRPLPEPVIREFSGTDGERCAIVTRNVYGALVLNADRLMFVDVDRKGASPNVGAALGKMVSSLFGKPKVEPPASNPILEAMNEVAQRHDLSARVYETAAGYRLLITSAPFEATSSEAEALLTEFDSDPLYVRLCRSQECFRARLTPKPWRCAMPNPPVEFPFETPEDQERSRRWEADYNAKTTSFATCRYVATVGTGSGSPDFDELIQYHDQETKAAADLRLA